MHKQSHPAAFRAKVPARGEAAMALLLPRRPWTHGPPARPSTVTLALALPAAVALAAMAFFALATAVELNRDLGSTHSARRDAWLALWGGSRP